MSSQLYADETRIYVTFKVDDYIDRINQDRKMHSRDTCMDGHTQVETERCQDGVCLPCFVTEWW